MPKSNDTIANFSIFKEQKISHLKWILKEQPTYVQRGVFEKPNYLVPNVFF